MAKKLFKRWMPDPHKIKTHKHLQIFGSWLHNPNLWHLNRRSISLAFAVGLFWAWIPIPSQMLCSAFCAIIFHANLPISVALVWLTNPLTMVPLFLFAYRVGAYMLTAPLESFEFQLSYEWLLDSMHRYGQPLMVGCLTLAATSSVLGYFFIRYFWRWHVVHHWQGRRQARRLKKQQSTHSSESDQ